MMNNVQIILLALIILMMPLIFKNGTERSKTMSEREWLQVCDEQHMKLLTAQVIADKACWASYQTGELGKTRTIISVSNEESVLIETAIGMYIEECHRILEEREREEQKDE